MTAKPTSSIWPIPNGFQTCSVDAHCRSHVGLFANVNDVCFVELISSRCLSNRMPECWNEEDLMHPQRLPPESRVQCDASAKGFINETCRIIVERDKLCVHIYSPRWSEILHNARIGGPFFAQRTKSRRQKLARLRQKFARFQKLARRTGVNGAGRCCRCCSL